jgi:hypothetical protein
MLVISSLFWKMAECLDVLEIMIPISLVSNEDMPIRLLAYFGIKTSSGYYQQFSVLLDIGKGGTTLLAKAFDMSTRLVIEGFDQVLSGQPMQGSGRGKQICCVGRACVLSAVSAMTEVEVLKITQYFEGDLPTKT